MLLAALSVACATAALQTPLRNNADVPRVDALSLASVDDALDVEGRKIAASAEGTRLTVPVMIGTAGPYRFLVDSGADRSVVGRRLSARLGLPGLGCARLHSIAGLSISPLVRVPALRIGSTPLRDLRAAVLPEPSLRAQGVLGIDALLDERISLDFEKSTITVEDAGTRLVEGEHDIVVTARRQRGQLILAEASAGGSPVFAVVDTGAEVTVGNTALRARVLGRGARADTEMIELTSVTGDRVKAELAYIPQLTIGRLRLRNVAIAFADVAPFAQFGLDRSPAILLGTDVLQGFRSVTLDFRRRKVRFSLR